MSDRPDEPPHTEPGSEPGAGHTPPPSPEVEAQPYDSTREAGPTYDVPPVGEERSTAAGGSLALAATCHLLGLADATMGFVLLGLIAPLILWLAMKDQDPEVDFAGKESINFQLNLLAWWIAGFLLLPCLIGIPILILLGLVLPVAEIALVIIATIQTLQGNRYRYPFIFRVLI
jgi:uncharacterized Tic20 family protein